MECTVNIIFDLNLVQLSDKPLVGCCLLKLKGRKTSLRAIMQKNLKLVEIWGKVVGYEIF